jgi:hypothetical protein
MIGDSARRDKKNDRRRDENDPVLLMLGVGKELWEAEPEDRFIERLRSEAPVTSRTPESVETTTLNSAR